MNTEQTNCPETSAHKIQTLGNYPEESIQHPEKDSLKSRIMNFSSIFWDITTCSSIFWNVVTCILIFWDVMICSSIFCYVMTCIFIFWDVMICSSIFWDVVTCSSIFCYWWRVVYAEESIKMKFCWQIFRLKCWCVLPSRIWYSITPLIAAITPSLYSLH
jgi:hypothetical protein